MKLINDQLAVKARLLPTTGDGYVMLAGEVGAWRGYFPSAPTRVATELKALATPIEAREVTVFRAQFRTPGEGGELLAARSCPPGAVRRRRADPHRVR